MSARAASAALAALLSFLCTTASADPYAPCYYPSGGVALGYYACVATAYITTCCPQGYTCYSNNLCVVTTPSDIFPNVTVGDAKRGACTNPKWNNAICGSFCLGEFDGKHDPERSGCPS